jgi:hypothetical protein
MGRANRYIGARNASTVKPLERDAFGLYYSPKATVKEVLAKSNKYPKMFRRLTSISKGDVWDNPDEAVARKESKAFHNPKEFGINN